MSRSNFKVSLNTAPLYSTQRRGCHAPRSLEGRRSTCIAATNLFLPARSSPPLIADLQEPAPMRYPRRGRHRRILTRNRHEHRVHRRSSEAAPQESRERPVSGRRSRRPRSRENLPHGRCQERPRPTERPKVRSSAPQAPSSRMTWRSPLSRCPGPVRKACVPAGMTSRDCQTASPVSELMYKTAESAPGGAGVWLTGSPVPGGSPVAYSRIGLPEPYGTVEYRRVTGTNTFCSRLSPRLHTPSGLGITGPSPKSSDDQVTWGKTEGPSFVIPTVRYIGLDPFRRPILEYLPFGIHDDGWMDPSREVTGAAR